MKQMTSETKQQQLERRRAKVLELSSQGYSEREIAEQLQPLADCTVQRFVISKTTSPREPAASHS
jgi:DNA-binding NarL/FixJ family response regulator